MSESFTNNAATGAANYPSSGTGATNSAGQSTLQFIYDASTNSYSVTTAGKSQSFSPGDKDASTSNAQITVYKKVNGQTTDTLTLTNPGTSGSLTYKYVGSGFWQRTVASSSATSGTFDAFTYGVETPDAALRRTGAATYTVDLLGVKSYQDALVSLRGSGTLDADFTLAKITTSGSINEYDQNGAVSPSGGWNGSADLSSTANSFSGPFTLNGSGNGTFAGRFYGPNTDEVGAAWYSVDAANGLAALGTLVGRYSKDIPTKDTNSTLLNIKYDTSFAAEGAYTDYLHQPGADTLIFAPLSSSYRNPVPFSYKVDTQTYTLTGLNLTAPSQFGPSQLSSALSDSKWTVYQDSNSYGSAMLKLYKAAGWDTSLALSYTGFGQWTLASKNAQGQDETYQQWFFYGLPRSQSGGGQVAVPTTGTATYNGSIFGIGTKGPGSNVADISGTANLAVNFGSQTFAGSMSPVATDRVTNAVVQLPTYSFSNGQLLAEQFTAGISVTNGPGSFNVGNLRGYFFGPQAQEIGATFSTTHAGDVNSDYSLQGIIVGKKP